MRQLAIDGRKTILLSRNDRIGQNDDVLQMQRVRMDVRTVFRRLTSDIRLLASRLGHHWVL